MGHLSIAILSSSLIIMDLNLNSLSDELFYFNEEGLILLKDTLEAVQTAYRKVRYLKAYVHDKIILNSKIIPKDTINERNETDQQNTSVAVIPETSGSEEEGSVHFPVTNLSCDQNVIKSSCHLSSRDLTSKEHLSSVEHPSINQEYSEDDLKVVLYVKFNRVTETMLKKLFEKSGFPSFVINSCKNLTDSSIGVISFARKEDVDRAVTLTYRRCIHNRPVIINRYGERSDDTQGIQNILPTGNTNSSKEIDENLLSNVSSDYQNNWLLNMGTSEEKSACSVTENVTYPVEPKCISEIDGNVNTFNFNSEASKNHSNYNITYKENCTRENNNKGKERGRRQWKRKGEHCKINNNNKQLHYLNSNSFKNETGLRLVINKMRDNRGLAFNISSPFLGREFMNNDPQTQLHFQKESPDFKNEVNKKCVENDKNSLNNTSSTLMPENKNISAHNLFNNLACNRDQKVDVFTSFPFRSAGPSHEGLGALNPTNYSGNCKQSQQEGWAGMSPRFSNDPIYKPIPGELCNSQQNVNSFQIHKKCSKTKHKGKRRNRARQNNKNKRNENKTLKHKLKKVHIRKKSQTAPNKRT